MNNPSSVLAIGGQFTDGAIENSEGTLTMHGTIGPVAMWGRGLSGSEINFLWNGGSGRKYGELEQ